MSKSNFPTATRKYGPMSIPTRVAANFGLGNMKCSLHASLEKPFPSLGRKAMNQPRVSQNVASLLMK